MFSLPRLYQAFLVVGSLLTTACGANQGGEEPGAKEVSESRGNELTLEQAALAQWSSVVTLPIVPVAAANLPDGKVLFWSAENRFSFGTDLGRTYTVIYNPATGTATERLVNETQHDMFCPGTANLPDGRVLVNGGLSSGVTSIYNPATNTWTRTDDMNIPRAYQGTTPLADGSVFTLGGSWAGGVGNKHGEIWTEAGGWRTLSGVRIDSFLSTDPTRAFGMDSHLWLIPAGNGRVFHAGPGVNMHWIDTAGNGSVTPIGPRGDDEFSINAGAVMFDTGKILKAGGAPGYEGMQANSNSYVIELGTDVTVRKIQSMAYRRAFHNFVVLPNGQVVVLGGMTVAVGFSDDNSVLAPEIFDPITETFTALPAMTVPRNYHSVALLLPDGRVLSAGGGLCGTGCAANHPDLQILSPPYLFNPDGSAATRPVIVTAPAQASHGSTLAVTTNSPVTSFAIVRASSSTHALNNDQRRLALTFSSLGGNNYAVDVPSNAGWAVPGIYMLFAMDANGVPSVAHTLRIDVSQLTLATPGDQTSTVGSSVSLALSASNPSGDTLTFSADGLPPGLDLDASSGLISGTPSTVGQYLVEASVTDGTQSVSTEFGWSIVQAGTTRFVRLQSLSEVNGNPWASAAELNLLDSNGLPLPRDLWIAATDSEELVGEDGAADNAIDGNQGSIWHTQWQAANPPHPHWLQIDLGANYTVTGLRYLPRQDGSQNGTIDEYLVYLSVDGINWGTPVAQGSFSALGGPVTGEKTIVWSVEPPPPTNNPPTIAQPSPPALEVGESANLALSANDPDLDPLTFSATGLPSGLTLDPNTGVITGTATLAGNFPVTVSVDDGRGGSASAEFTWLVGDAPPSVEPVVAPIVSSGTSANYSAAATGGGTLEYSWDFGDGSGQTPFTSSPNASHAFPGPGVYVVTLTVRNGNGGATSTQFLQAVAGPVVTGKPVSSSNLVITSGATPRLFSVNIDNNSVSAFDAATLEKLAEIPVGDRPRTAAVGPDGRVWVTNSGSNTISIISSSTLAILKTVNLPRASRPFGIVVGSNNLAYVALEGIGTVRKLSRSGGSLANLGVGPNPRQLSLTANADRLLVSRFITPPQPGESTGVVETEVGGQPQGGEVVILNTPALTLKGSVVLQHSDKPDTTISGRGVPNYLGAAVVSPDGQSAWVPSKQDNIQRGILRDGLNLDFQNTVRAISSRIDLGSETEDYGARIDHDNSGIAVAGAFHPSGAYLFVALEASRHVAVLDAYGERELFRVDAGRAPQALVVSADGLKLYVHNALDRSIGVYDLAPLVQQGAPELPLLQTLGTVAVEALSPAVLLGKQLFYDARDTRIALDGYVSCASCHNDGGQDGRTWDLTGFGEGLRNTINLRGRAGAQGRLHWTANFDEVQDFESQIRGLNSGSGLMSNADFLFGTRMHPLGDAKAGVSADLDALAAYVTSLSSFDRTPYRSSSGGLTSPAVAGRTVFGYACASCHGGTDFTDSASNLLHDVGTLEPSSGTRLGELLTGIDTPTLRDAWATAPYLHDGSAQTIEAAIQAHTGLVSLTATELTNVIAFVNQIGSEQAAVAVPNGLLGEYFLGQTLSGETVLKRAGAVNYNWGLNAPIAQLTADNFSIRWTGFVTPASSGPHFFRTISNDGVRLWVDGVLLIDNWTDHASTTDTSAAVELVGGQRYAIRLEYYDNTTESTIRLQWRRPGTTTYVAIAATQLKPL